MTRRVLKVLELWREEERDKWEDGALTAESNDGTMQLNAEAIGRCRLIKKILDLDHEELQKELEEDAQH